MTGFRVHPAGAQALYGIAPDLTCLGKVVGGGLPAAAYGGRRALMEQIAPAGPGVPGGHALGQPAGDGRRAGDARRARRVPAPGSGPSGWAACAADAHRRGAAAAAGVPLTRAARGHDADAVLHRRTGARTTPTPSAPTRAAYGALLPRHARRGRLPPAVARSRPRSPPPFTATWSSPRSRPRWAPHGRGSGRRRGHRRADRGLPAEAARSAGSWSTRPATGWAASIRTEAIGRLSRRAGAELPLDALAGAARPDRGAGAGAEPRCRVSRRQEPLHRPQERRCRSRFPPGPPHHAAALQRRQARGFRRAAGRSRRLAGGGERRDLRPPPVQSGSPGLRGEPVRRRIYAGDPEQLSVRHALRSCTGSSAPTARSSRRSAA